MAANSQYIHSVASNRNKSILPRSSRRREAGWDSTLFSTNLVAWHVPNNRPAHYTHVPVVHFNVNDGITMIIWRQYWEDRSETAFVTLPNGRKFLVLVPHDRSAYQDSEPIEARLGFPWRGELLVFACAINNGLLVNMRTWKEDRDRAWDVVRRYIVGDVDGNVDEDMNESVVSTDDMIDIDLPSVDEPSVYVDSDEMDGDTEIGDGEVEGDGYGDNEENGEQEEQEQEDEYEDEEDEEDEEEYGTPV